MANPRKLRLIYQNESKSDRVDAGYLTRGGRIDPSLLAPLRHRSAQAQEDLAVLRSRMCLIRARTRLINHVRGAVKSLGGRLPSYGSDAFARKAEVHIPEELRPALTPMLATIAQITDEIKAFDKLIEKTIRDNYPETALPTQVPGVGILAAQRLLLTIEDPGPLSEGPGSDLVSEPASPPS